MMFIKSKERFILAMAVYATVLLWPHPAYAAPMSKEINGSSVGEGVEHERPDDAGFVGDVSTGMRAAFDKRHDIHTTCSDKLVSVMISEGEDAEYAAILIREGRCQGLLESVKSAARNVNPRTRATIAEVLGGFDESGIADALENMLSDDDDMVRATALRSLCTAAPGRCRRHLAVMAMTDHSWRVRKRAVLMSRQVGYRFGASESSLLVNDDAASVQISSLGQLECGSIRQIRPDIIRLITALNVDVSNAAIQAAGRCSICAARDVLLQEFARAQCNDDGSIVSILDALASCADRNVRVAIEGYISTCKSPADAATIDAANIRSALEVAYDMLRSMGGITDATVIKRGLQDPYYRVRLAAIRAIAVDAGLERRYRGELHRIAEEDPSVAVRELAKSVGK